MNCAFIPNALTASRLVLLVPIMVLLTGDPSPAAGWVAFGLLVTAGVTDALDGWAARRLHAVTPLGTFFDPLVDKVFANVLLVFLAVRCPGWVPPWLVLLILVREFAVQGLRSMAPCKGVLIRTGLVSKLKLVFQLISTGAVLLGLALGGQNAWLRALALANLWLAAAAAYASLASLLWRHRDLWARPDVALEVR